jgi:hypothetical protein
MSRRSSDDAERDEQSTDVQEQGLRVVRKVDGPTASRAGLGRTGGPIALARQSPWAVEPSATSSSLILGPPPRIGAKTSSSNGSSGGWAKAVGKYRVAPRASGVARARNASLLFSFCALASSGSRGCNPTASPALRDRGRGAQRDRGTVGRRDKRQEGIGGICPGCRAGADLVGARTTGLRKR